MGIPTRLIRGYYLSSPLFFALGWWWGLEVRATFLPDLETRFAYYVFLSALGLLAHFRPPTAPYVALGESTLNLFLLMAWILFPIWNLVDHAQSGPLGLPYSAPEVMVNGVLAGGFCLVGFYGAQGEILARLSFLRRR